MRCALHRLVLVAATSVAVMLAAELASVPLATSELAPAVAGAAPGASPAATRASAPRTTAGAPAAVRKPAPSPSPTRTPKPTATASAPASTVVVIIVTATPTRTPLATPTATSTPVPTATSTPTPAPRSTSPPAATPLPSLTPVPTATTLPPVVSDLAVNSITSSAATITWTTSRATASQVEFGPTSTFERRSTPDVDVLVRHSHVLADLLPGTLYHYRVTTLDTDGHVVLSPEATFVTAPAGSGPSVIGLGLKSVSSTTAELQWTTQSGSVAQVEYGPSANYGSFTLLQPFAEPAQSMHLSGLRPTTPYHVRVKAWDAFGFLGASSDYVITTAAAGQATLLGDPTLQPKPSGVAAGQAIAFAMTAAGSGLGRTAHVYLDAGSGPAPVRLALYADAGGGPGAVLTQSTITAPKAGAWNTVALPPVSVAAGSRYWIALLRPAGSGSLALREAPSPGSVALSAQTTLAAFPATWTGTAAAGRGTAAVFIEQVPPSVSVTSPADGDTVNGAVPLSASVDDDAALSAVQFLVDGQPAGPPLTAPPYATTWRADSVTGGVQVHLITAVATDAQGRSGASAPVSISVDAGPRLLQVSANRRLSASSAVVSWQTDVPADAQVEFGPTDAYGRSTALDAAPTTSHVAQLIGLAPGTTYHFRVKSRDAAGVLAVSADFTFTTLADSLGPE